MHHSIELSDQAFRAFSQTARELGLSVADYLNQSAQAKIEPDGFSLTPEVRAGIERGLADAESGRLVSPDEVQQTLAEHKAKWRERQS